MKRITLLIITCILLTNEAYSQFYWDIVEPGPYVSGIVPNQTSDDHHLKYWYYRWRLRENFMKIGKGAGESLIADVRNTNMSTTGDPLLQNEGIHLRFSDQTVFLGFYIGVLATEYRSLSYNGQNTDQTVKELYHALWALNRLDAGEENYFKNVDPIPAVGNYYDENKHYDGFLIRDDADRNYFDYSHFENSPVPSIYDSIPSKVNSDWVYHKYYEDGASYFGVNDTVTRQEAFDYRNEHGRNEMSQDQVVYLYTGLALVRRFIPNEVEYFENGQVQYFNGKDQNKTSLAEVARRITTRIASHCNATNVNTYFGSWLLRNRSRTGGYFSAQGPFVQDGLYMGGFAKGIANAGCFAINKTNSQDPCDHSSLAQYLGGWIFGNGGTDESIHNWYTNTFTGPGHLTYAFARDLAGVVNIQDFNGHMSNTICALNGRKFSSGVNPFIGINDPYKDTYLELIEWQQTDYAVFLKAALHGKPVPQNIVDKTFDLLSTAPCTGPYKYVDQKGNIIYANRNWSSDDRLIHPERIGTDEFTGEANGLDYMLYHNLYYIYNKDYYTNPVNMIEHDVTIDLPENDNIGIINNPLTCNTFRLLKATNTIKANSPNGTPSNVKYRSGVEVCLEPGFETEPGAKFEAYVSPFVCGDIELKKDGENHDEGTSNLYGMNYGDDYSVTNEVQHTLDYPFKHDETDPDVEMDFSNIREEDYDAIGNPTIEQIMGLDSNYIVFLQELANQLDEEAKNNYLDSINNATPGGNQRMSNPQKDLIFSLSPNPAREKLNLGLLGEINDELIHVNVSNSIGQKVLEFDYAYTYLHSIDVSNLTKGVYSVTIYLGDKVITRKFTKI